MRRAVRSVVQRINDEFGVGVVPHAAAGGSDEVRQLKLKFYCDTISEGRSVWSRA